MFSFQCTSDKNGCAAIAHESIKNDTDNVRDDDTLSPADLMTFAWQIAKGMVRTGLRACIMSRFAKLFAICNIKIHPLMALFADCCFPFH